MSDGSSNQLMIDMRAVVDAGTVVAMRLMSDTNNSACLMHRNGQPRMKDNGKFAVDRMLENDKGKKIWPFLVFSLTSNFDESIDRIAVEALYSVLHAVS